jgi:DNA-binding transcriptional ArsR family regulator
MTAMGRPRGSGVPPEERAKEARPANVFEALADPTRREVVRRLAEGGPATATDLAGELPVTRQAVAKHLATLAEAGLVASDRQGREIRFSFTPQPLADAVTWMADVGRQWDDRLQALSQYLETGEPRPRKRRAGFDTDR